MIIFQYCVSYQRPKSYFKKCTYTIEGFSNYECFLEKSCPQSLSSLTLVCITARSLWLRSLSCRSVAWWSWDAWRRLVISASCSFTERRRTSFSACRPTNTQLSWSPVYNTHTNTKKAQFGRCSADLDAIGQLQTWTNMTKRSFVLSIYLPGCVMCQYLTIWR